MLRKKIRGGTSSAARCRTRGSRRLRFSVSRLLKTTLQPPTGTPAQLTWEGPSPVPPEPEKRWLTRPSPEAP